MLEHNLIASSLIALGSWSMATVRARADGGSSVLDRTIGAQKEATGTAPSRDNDGGHQRRVVEQRGSRGPRLIIVSNRVAVPEQGNNS